MSANLWKHVTQQDIILVKLDIYELWKYLSSLCNNKTSVHLIYQLDMKLQLQPTGSYM